LFYSKKSWERWKSAEGRRDVGIQCAANRLLWKGWNGVECALVGERGHPACLHGLVKKGKVEAGDGREWADEVGGFKIVPFSVY